MQIYIRTFTSIDVRGTTYFLISYCPHTSVITVLIVGIFTVTTVTFKASFWTEFGALTMPVDSIEQSASSFAGLVKTSSSFSVTSTDKMAALCTSYKGHKQCNYDENEYCWPLHLKKNTDRTCLNLHHVFKVSYMYMFIKFVYSSVPNFSVCEI